MGLRRTLAAGLLTALLYQPAQAQVAVLLNGDRRAETVAELSIAYQVLLEQGFAPKDVHVLSNSRGVMSDYFYPSQGPLTKETLDALMDKLEGEIKGGRLVVYFMNHGARGEIEGRQTLQCAIPGAYLHPESFQSYFERLRADERILIFQVCNSGILTQRLDLDNTVIITASDYEHGAQSGMGQNFGGFFFMAYRDAKADKDADGKVTLGEAFRYARAQLTHDDNPQMCSTGIDAERITLKQDPLPQARP